MTPSQQRRAFGVAALTGFALATSSLTAAQAGDAPLAPLHAAGPGAVAGDYIVVLDADSPTTRVLAVADAAVAAGATIGNTYTTAIKGFSATLPTAALAAVRAADGVAYVESDVFATLDLPSGSAVDGTQPNPPWGLDRVDERNRPLNNKYTWKKSGDGVTAYVIDTGVRFSHNEFQGRAVSGPDFYDDDDDSSDCHGHGTHVSGTVGGKTYGVAKDVSIVGIRTISCSGGGVVSDSIAAVDWVTANAKGRSVMNMSLHFGVVQALEDAIKRAFKEDILFSAAAANDNQDACNDSPSGEKTAITVAASTINDEEAYFSNHGPCVDIYAPGLDVESAWYTSDSATAVLSGTSMAAPHVAGGVALALEKKPTHSAQQITDLLIKKSSKGKITNPDPGTVNRLLFTKRF